jgi:hypothetical protein
MDTDGCKTQRRRGRKEPQIFFTRSFSTASASLRLFFIHVHPWLKFFLLCRFRPEFQNFAGLAIQRFADRLERGEADGLGLAGFEDGQVLRRDVHGVREIVQPHFALREHHVEIDDDGHKLKPSIPVPLAVPVLRGKTKRQISKSMRQTIRPNPVENGKD